MNNDILIAYSDGASRGNPGHAGLGVVICDESGEILKEVNEYIGICTSPVAEYRAFLKAVSEGLSLGARTLRVYSDSELIVKQFNGEYRTKDDNLKELLKTAREMEKAFSKLELIHIRRSSHPHNKKVDKLANIAINKHVS